MWLKHSRCWHDTVWWNVECRTCAQNPVTWNYRLCLFIGETRRRYIESPKSRSIVKKSLTCVFPHVLSEFFMSNKLRSRDKPQKTALHLSACMPSSGYHIGRKASYARSRVTTGLTGVVYNKANIRHNNFRGYSVKRPTVIYRRITASFDSQSSLLPRAKSREVVMLEQVLGHPPSPYPPTVGWLHGQVIIFF